MLSITVFTQLAALQELLSVNLSLFVTPQVGTAILVTVQ